MGVPALEVGYISATTGRGDHEVHKGHVVALGRGEKHKDQCTFLTISHSGILKIRNFLGKFVQKAKTHTLLSTNCPEIMPFMRWYGKW
jgi:hypothetical protein